MDVAPTMTLNVKKGKLTLISSISKGLSDKDISGNNSARVVLEGSITSINQVLSTPNGIIYQGNQDYFGADNLTISIDSDKRSRPVDVAITVNPVNDPPELINNIAKPLEITPPSEPKSDRSEKTEKPLQTPSSVPTKNPGNANATIGGQPGSKNIRSGPGTVYSSKHTAYTGNRVRVMESANDSGGYTWYKVYFPEAGVDGWIAAQLLNIDRTDRE